MLASNVEMSVPTSLAPPSNVDAEIAVLGGLMLDPVAYDRIAESLHPQIFSTEAHRTLCKAILLLRESGRSSDMISVVSKLSERGEIQRVGGKMAVMRIFDLCITAVNIDQHVELLVDKFVRRQAIVLAQGLRSAAYDSEAIGVALDKASERLVALSLQQTSKADLENLAEIWLRAFPEVEKRQENPGLIGVSTGLYDLDAMLGGLQPGALITVAARPAMGKSALVMQIAAHVAQSKPVAVFSLEMAKFDLVYRAIASVSGVSISKIRSGQLSPYEMGLVTSASDKVSEHCWVSENPCPTVTEINAQVRSLKMRQGRLGAVIVDYLQLMGTGTDNRVQELSKITRSLKIMSRTLDVPVVILSQLSRAVESRQNKRPLQSDLRESGAIEQDSDQIVFLYRDEYYNPDTPERGICELIVAKNRNGPTGTVKVLFEAHLTRFRNLARGTNG